IPAYFRFWSQANSRVPTPTIEPAGISRKPGQRRGKSGTIGASFTSGDTNMPHTDTAPAGTNPPAQTQGFVFNHTMLRIKDPRASLDFYTRVFGMELLESKDMPT